MLIIGLLVFVALDVASAYFVGRIFDNIPAAFWVTALISFIGFQLAARRIRGVSQASLMESVARGQDPMSAATKTLLPAVGAIFLAVPGFLSDLMAIPFLIPAFRAPLAGFLKSLLMSLTTRAMKKHGSAFGDDPKLRDLMEQMQRGGGPKRGGGPIIDTEGRVVPPGSGKKAS